MADAELQAQYEWFLDQMEALADDLRKRNVWMSYLTIEETGLFPTPEQIQALGERDLRSLTAAKGASHLVISEALLIAGIRRRSRAIIYHHLRSKDVATTKRLCRKHFGRALTWPKRRDRAILVRTDQRARS